MELKNYIRTIPDFPEPGIMFRDVTTLFSDKVAFSAMVNEFKKLWEGVDIDYVAGIDARGFIIGGALAYSLNIGFVPIRKKGKLPFKTFEQNYNLEYGTATLEIHQDAFEPNAKILLIDDLIATGGTALAAVKLLQSLDADIIGASFLIDLPDLFGSSALVSNGVSVKSICTFDGH